MIPKLYRSSRGDFQTLREQSTWNISYTSSNEMTGKMKEHISYNKQHSCTITTIVPFSQTTDLQRGVLNSCPQLRTCSSRKLVRVKASASLQKFSKTNMSKFPKSLHLRNEYHTFQLLPVNTRENIFRLS